MKGTLLLKDLQIKTHSHLRQFLSFHPIKILICALLFISISNTYAKRPSPWSLSPKEMKQFIERCPLKIDLNKMTRFVKNQLKVNKKWNWVPNELAHLKEGATITSILIDGYKVHHLTLPEIHFLLKLTAESDFYSPLHQHKYKMNVTFNDNKLIINRECFAYNCRTQQKKLYDLSHLNTEKICKDIFCVLNHLFGKEKGTYYLYSQIKYNLFLSPYSHVGSHSNGFSLDTLKAILYAAELTPKHLWQRVHFQKRFYRIKKAKFGLDGAIANAYGMVYNYIQTVPFYTKVYVFFHEMGHRASIEETFNYAESNEWINISRLEEHHKFSVKTSQSDKKDFPPSEQAMINYDEDFAESFLSYRLHPIWLLWQSPKRYEYMKTNFFNGVEYIDSPCL